MQLRTLTFVVLSAGFLSSCGDETNPTPTGSTPSSNTPSATPTPVPNANRPPGPVSVEFQPKTPILAGATAVSFAATATDPDRDSLTYKWDFCEEEVSTQGGGVVYTFNRGGSCRVRVTVSDGKGGTSTGETSVTINTLEGEWALVSPVGQNMTTRIRHNGRSFSGQFSDGRHSFTGNVNDGNRLFMRLEDGGDFYCLTGGNYNGTINTSLDYMDFSRGPGCYQFGLRRL
jgi:PKD repeat protein